MPAVLTGDLDIARLLVKHGAKPEKPESPPNMTMLETAVMNNDVEMLRFLIAQGADVNERDDQQMTALMYTALLHRPALAKELLAAGADPALVDKYGYTAKKHEIDID